MKKYNKLFITIISLFITTSVVAQWTKGKGKGYYKLSTWSLVANKHYTDTGETDPNATRGTFTTSFYAEYGVSNKFDLIAFVPFFTINYQNKVIGATRGTLLSEGASLNSFGDTDIGIRYALVKKSKVALSAMVKFGIPTGKTTGGNEQAILQAGDGEFNQHLQLDLGLPFKLFNISSYGKALAGYNIRSEGFSDEIHFGTEVGFNLLSSKIWLVGRFYVLKSTKNGNEDIAANGSIFANNIEYNNLGFEAAYYISKKIGVSYTFTTAVSGRIISAAPSHSAGIFLDIK